MNTIPSSRVVVLIAGCVLLVGVCFFPIDRKLCNDCSLVPVNPLQEYAGHLHTTVIRMLYNGIPIEKIRFNSPNQLKTLKDPRFGVFDPRGGRVAYETAPAKYMADKRDGHAWVFNAELRTGTSAVKNDGRSIIAYLIGVDKNVCAHLDEQQGIMPIPRLRSDQSSLYTQNMVDGGIKDYLFPKDNPPLLDTPTLLRTPIGCFQSHKGDTYVYYYVILSFLQSNIGG
jgi:hypothetical protein